MVDKEICGKKTVINPLGELVSCFHQITVVCCRKFRESKDRYLYSIQTTQSIYRLKGYIWHCECEGQQNQKGASDKFIAIF